MLNPQFFNFIAQNIACDPIKLRLKHRESADFDLPLALEQIEIRQKKSPKLPTWDNNLELLFPAGITFEQASSEITARYKQRFLNGTKVCDLTGGLGIDSLYLSRVFEVSTYIERHANYCEIARYNFKKLGANNITVVHSDCQTYLEGCDTCFDTIYLDPARRGASNARLFALSDYEPNVEELLPTLLKRSKQVIIKVSPMVDITQAIIALPQTNEVHVVSVKNECKEVLLVIRPEACSNPTIYCANYLSEEKCEEFRFEYLSEKEAHLGHYAQTLHYLYEPNASILKAGAFKIIVHHFGVEKLHPHSHLYGSEQLVERFQGRIFEVEEVIEFSGKALKQLKTRFPQANITTRNFPLTVKEIRQKSNIKEGGDCYLFATTIHPNRRIIAICHKPIA